MKPLLTPDEVAGVLKVKTRTVMEWLRAGSLKGVKAGREWRITEEAVAEFLQPAPAKTEEPAPEDAP